MIQCNTLHWKNKIIIQINIKRSKTYISKRISLSLSLSDDITIRCYWRYESFCYVTKVSNCNGTPVEPYSPKTKNAKKKKKKKKIAKLDILFCLKGLFSAKLHGLLISQKYINYNY